MMDIEFAERLLMTALRKGADEAEAFVKTSKNLGIEVKDRKVDTLESSVTGGFCIRVIKDRRTGFSYSTDPAEIDSVVDTALEASMYSGPDECSGLPVPAGPPMPGGEKGAAAGEIFDAAIASLSESDAIRYTLLIEDSACSEDSRIRKIRKASGNFSASHTYILNSHGVKAGYSSTGCSAQLTAIAEEGNESQMGWDYSGSRFLRDVSFEQVGRNAARRAVQLLGARKISPLKGYVLLDNSIASEFLSVLAPALSSEAVQKNKSMFAGRKGARVLSRKVDVTDDGLLSGRLGTKPVDDEGVPTTRRILIGEGVLRGFLYNTCTAKREGVSSTGNAVRGGFAGLPSVGPSNLYLGPSEVEHPQAFDMLIKTMDRGIYVIETMGMHTANPISGEFLVGASGLWVENGEIKYPVKEAVISGNILGLFNNILMVGDDLRFYGNIGSPSLLIEDIDISG